MSETDEVVFPWTDKKASDMQTGVTITGNKITGTLKYIEDGLAPDGYLSGSGNFLALKWSDPDDGVTSLKVGLVPSQGAGMQECIDDPDRNGIFKISSNDQVLKFVQTDGTHTNVQTFDLSGLTLEDAGA